ncbi:MAG: Ig-like domain-containing protein, partial [Chloroflexota bacterium]
MKIAMKILSNLFILGLILVMTVSIVGFLDEIAINRLAGASASVERSLDQTESSVTDQSQAEIVPIESDVQSDEFQVEAPKAVTQEAENLAAQIDKRLIGTVDLKWAGVGPLDFDWPAEELSEITTDANIDLSFFIDEGDGDTVTSFVDLEYTLVFTTQQMISATVGTADPVMLDVGPKSEGTLAGNQLSLLSERHPYTTESGRAVERQFRLTAGPSQNEDVWLGEYRETVWGMGPDPFTIIGSFELRELPLSDSAVIVNNPPQGVPDEVNVAAGETVTIDVLANDMALEGELDPTSVEIVEQPTQGTVNVNALSGEITYVAAANG